MINLMKRHPYEIVLIAVVVALLALGVLLNAKVEGIATHTGVILDGTSTEVTSKPTHPILMSGKGLHIVELKEQIASLQNELALLEAN